MKPLTDKEFEEQKEGWILDGAGCLVATIEALKEKLLKLQKDLNPTIHELLKENERLKGALDNAGALAEEQTYLAMQLGQKNEKLNEFLQQKEHEEKEIFNAGFKRGLAEKYKND